MSVSRSYDFFILVVVVVVVVAVVVSSSFETAEILSLDYVCK